MDYTQSNVTDCIIEADMAIEKGMLILGGVTTKYPFDGVMTAEEEREWLYENQRIKTLLDIAFDYMATAADKIAQAKRLDKEQRKLKQEGIHLYETRTSLSQTVVYIIAGNASNEDIVAMVSFMGNLQL